jgi:hypothetical protein
MQSAKSDKNLSGLNPPLGVQQGGACHRFERAENPQPARDDVKIGRAVGSRIKCDVLGMLDGDSVPVLEIENEGAERSLAYETLNRGSNDGGFHRDDPLHVYLWAS